MFGFFTTRKEIFAIRAFSFLFHGHPVAELVRGESDLVGGTGEGNFGKEFVVHGGCGRDSASRQVGQHGAHQVPGIARTSMGEGSFGATGRGAWDPNIGHSGEEVFPKGQRFEKF